MKSAFVAIVLASACASAEAAKTEPVAVPIASAPPVVTSAPVASAAPVVEPPPDVPEGCFGADLSVHLAFKGQHCAAPAGAVAMPVDAGVKVTMHTEPTVVGGAGLRVVVHFENETDRQQHLWLSRPGFATGIGTFSDLTVSASDEKGRSVDVPPSLGLGGGGLGRSVAPLLIHLVLAPHGIATGEATWMAVGFAQDEPSVPRLPPPPPAPAKPKKPAKKLSPRQAALAEAAEFAMGGLLASPEPLAPGTYHLSVYTSLIGGADLRGDVTVVR